MTFCIPHSAAHHVGDLQRRLVVLSVTATVCQWEVSPTMAPVWLMGERNSRQSFILCLTTTLSALCPILLVISTTFDQHSLTQLPHPHSPVNIHLKNTHTHHTHTLAYQCISMSERVRSLNRVENQFESNECLPGGSMAGV